MFDNSSFVIYILSMTNIASIYQQASTYPHVTSDAFVASSIIEIADGEVLHDPNLARMVIEREGTPLSLPDSCSDVPTYKVALNRADPQKVFERRVAIIGIGSNCSPDVLIKKFQSAGVGGEFLILQATLHESAVVHGAFIGGKATVPATVMPYKETHTDVTVGFYTPEQAAALTGTEPNYELLQMKNSLAVRGSDAVSAFDPGALLYVSVWGALTLDKTLPIALQDIPSRTQLQKMNSPQIMQEVAELLGRSGNVEEFFNSILTLPVAERLEHIFNIRNMGCALPAEFAGTCVKKSSIAELCSPENPAPHIRYL